MAKNDKPDSTDSLPPSPKVMVRAPQVKAYSFDQWAKLRMVPSRHLGGMRSWLGDSANFKHPLDKWDELFKAY